MGKGLLFKLVKWSRAIRIFFGRYTAMETKHYLFTVSPLNAQQIYAKVIPDGWQWNALSTTYKRQVFTVRKLSDIMHQWHIRFYSGGEVSGHWELIPEMFPVEHLQGKELRNLTPEEKEHLWELLHDS